MAFTETLPESLEKLINSLNEKFELNPNLKPSEIVKAIEEVDIQESDIMPWSDFNHPGEDSYGRKMIYKHPNYEIMAMSWVPGDFASIHDHGHTQWGAVKLFGPAEHATFRWQDDELTTLSRQNFSKGKIVGVSHSLIHSMGNPTDQPYLTLHVYGTSSPEESITGDARLFNLEKGRIERINGGVFFELPEEEIVKTQDGPKGDFPTRTRYLIDLMRRLSNFNSNQEDRIKNIYNDVFSSSHLKELQEFLNEITDEHDHTSNSSQWQILNFELEELAKSQKSSSLNNDDAFDKYAELYDSLICKPCKDGFILNYFRHFISTYLNGNIQDKTILSLGCGTGMIEKDLIEELSLNSNNLKGIDYSEAMVKEAQKRINAEKGDLLELDLQGYDIAYSGLNVFQYLPANGLEKAIQNTANALNTGGWFIGDFITPDHIRWYPNVMYNNNKDIISLRTPRLIEKEGKTYQESEIINLDFREDLADVNYAGKHARYLAPIVRVREYFKKAFNSEPMLLDAFSLEEIKPDSDTCSSTRYVVIIQKK